MQTETGINPENPDALTDGEEPTRYGADLTPGDWLQEEDEAKVVKALLKRWTDQDRMHARYLAQARVNEMRREGQVNVDIRKSQDRDEWTVVTYGATVPISNKAARLCRKLRSALFVDPPVGDPVPNSGEDHDRDAAQFAARVLLDVQGESGLNSALAAAEAFDKGAVWGSGYTWHYVDDHGRLVPVQIEAHPQAQTADQPFQGLDPLTGQPMELPTTEAVLRYVRPDGSLSDEKRDAALQWVPTLRREILTGAQVRFLPATANDLWDAEGALVASFVPWGKLRKLFPDLAQMPEDERKKLWGWAPEKSRHLAPGTTRGEREAILSLTGDDALCFVLRAYVGACAEYPYGAYVITAGQDRLLYRGEWAVEVNGVKEALLIPLSQYKQWDEGREHPAGVGTMELIGPGNEVRAQALGTLLDYLDRLNRRKTFLPTNSLLRPSQLTDPDVQIHYINPGGGPTYEEIPPFDRAALTMAEQADQDMDADVGSPGLAEDLQSPNIKSGRQAYATIAQAHTALGELKQNIERAFVRDCRIQLQLIRGHYTVPQRLKYGSPETGFREKRWTGADLGSTQDVRIKPGTMTLLAPLVKSEIAFQWATPTQAGAPALVGADELRSIVTANSGTLIGLQDEPHRVRVQRQLDAWAEGPPPGWRHPQPVAVQGPQGPMLQTPPDPVIQALFSPTPADEVQAVALIRVTEIGRAMASQAYQRWPPAWRAGLDQEFQRMRQFAGVLTVPEQQQAQQMAQAQQDQRAQAQQAAETGDQREQARAEALSRGQAA